VIDALLLRRRRLWSWLTSSGIPGDTVAERASERNRRAATSAVGGLALRGTSFVVVLISVPLTLELLGPARFGMWMTIASVIALLGAADLGIGNGILNSVAQAFGRNDRAAARQFTASGFVALAAIATILGALFAVAYPVVPWATLYNVSADPLAASEAGPATAALVVTFLIGLPLGAAGAVRSAYQEGFLQSAFVGLGNLLTVFLLLAAVSARASLPVLVVALASGPILAGVINLMVLLRIQRPWLTPRREDITLGAMRSVVGVGMAFMVLQIAYTLAFSTDRLVVAHIVGPTAVADYSVVQRLFSIPAGLAAVAFVPLWPAYREAISRQDIDWVRQTVRRSLMLAVATIVPLTLVLTVGGSALVEIWTSGTLSPSTNLYLAMGAFTIAYTLANTFGMVLNGALALRFLISTWCLMAALNIVGSIYLASRIGVAGVAWGSAIAVIAALLLPAVVFVPRMIQRLERGDTTGPISLAIGDGDVIPPAKPDLS
jgi:O-antigen/teichoic acid export membrane protein